MSQERDSANGKDFKVERKEGRTPAVQRIEIDLADTEAFETLSSPRTLIDYAQSNLEGNMLVLPPNLKRTAVLPVPSIQRLQETAQRLEGSNVSLSIIRHNLTTNESPQVYPAPLELATSFTYNYSGLEVGIDGSVYQSMAAYALAKSSLNPQERQAAIEHYVKENLTDLTDRRMTLIAVPFREEKDKQRSATHLALAELALINPTTGLPFKTYEVDGGKKKDVYAFVHGPDGSYLREVNTRIAEQLLQDSNFEGVFLTIDNSWSGNSATPEVVAENERRKQAFPMEDTYHAQQEGVVMQKMVESWQAKSSQ